MELVFNNNYGNFRATQTTGYAVTSAGEVLTLTVGVGNYNNAMKAAWYQGTINITVGGVDVATNTAGNPNAFTPTAPATSFADATLTYTTTAADIGQFVGIDLNIGPKVGATKVAFYDNVRLDVVSVPEPTTGLMMMMGMAGTLLAGRRRRNLQ